MQAGEMISAGNFDRLNRGLDRLENMAIGVESWLSVLKRRRELARIHEPSMENYRKSVNNAIMAFPMSQPIAAIAAEILVKNTAINRETEENLRHWLSVINDPSFNTLRLGLHILLGDFRSPERAALVSSDLLSDGTEAVSVNLLILKILRDDIRSAASDIQTMLYSPSPSVNTLRLAAEFYYDFGDIRRSAELFNLINDEKAMSRQADALYLAGFDSSARAVWSMLEYTQNPRIFYNLGVIAENQDEAASWLEKLINSDSSANIDSLPVSAARQYGIIRYSRMLDYQQAVQLLESTEGLNPSLYPHIDLELLRRLAERRELGRQLAEAWLLLDRHEQSQDLYRWAAWLFLFQRNYIELNILLNRMENLWPQDQWTKSLRAIQLMFEGDLERAENILRLIPPQEAFWFVHANLGRIAEAHLSTARALEQYEIAMTKTQNPKTAAAVQIRMAKCFSTLGRTRDAQGALQHAIALDPENLTARFELERLHYR
jgi:tetratricopeptide (TPR) repeat protein